MTFFWHLKNHKHSLSNKMLHLYFQGAQYSNTSTAAPASTTLQSTAWLCLQEAIYSSHRNVPYLVCAQILMSNRISTWYFNYQYASNLDKPFSALKFNRQSTCLTTFLSCSCFHLVEIMLDKSQFILVTMLQLRSETLA